MPEFVQEFVEMVFNGSAEYQIKIFKSGNKKFTSYTQLKRRQKNIRRALGLALLILISWLGGLLVAPVFFPQSAETEIYIPSGKGDILVSNVSKNQATVIFKTLDGANGNRPLATKAVVEFYEDENFTDLARRITEDEYAVTHIVAADSLQEGKVYFIKIVAQDSANPIHTKTVSTWGGGSEPIKVFTTGELVPVCVQSDKKNEEKIEQVAYPIDTQQEEDVENKSDKLSIESVMNESYLQPGNKVQGIISWMTNLPATTSITYREDQTGERKNLLISEDMGLKHAAVLTTLKPASVYYFTVESKDADGNVVTSEEYSLRTPRAQENIIHKIGNNFKELLIQIKPR